MRSRTFLALVVAVFALYAPTAGRAFVEYDTGAYLTANPRVLSGLSWDNVRWAFTAFHAANWHPLTWLSHMLDVDLFGLAPAGHHLENAAWHAANAVLVLALLERLGCARAFAFAGALLFAVHPLRVESVAWIVERKDLLCAFFGLASLLAWLSASRGAALALYACSLMSKPMLVTLPFLILLLDPQARKRVRMMSGFIALTLVVGVITLRAQSASGAVQAAELLPLSLRVENALDAYLWYLGKTLWPTGLAFHYPLALHELHVGRMLAEAALLAALTWGAWRSPSLRNGWLWFLGLLVPVIGLVQVGGQAHADRYTYLPGIGLVLALCLLAERTLLPRVGARALALLGVAAASALAVLSWRQIATWRDTETLARHALEVTRENNVACDVLGAHYAEAGRLDEALPLLREAVRIAPRDPDALANLGATLLRRHELDESEALLLRASELAPARAQTWSLLGGLYVERSRYADALVALDRALALDPQHIGAWQNRAAALEGLGRLEEALAALRRATALRGNDWTAQRMLARVLLRLGRPEEARAPLELVLAHEPGDFDALRGLERVALARGDVPSAWQHAQAAARARPDSAPILADQAWILALATEGPLAQPQRALQLAQQALDAGGEQPALLDAFAFAAAANGAFERALPAAEQALRLVREADPAWAARLEKRIAAYREKRVDRETPR